MASPQPVARGGGGFTTRCAGGTETGSVMLPSFFREDVARIWRRAEASTGDRKETRKSPPCAKFAQHRVSESTGEWIRAFPLSFCRRVFSRWLISVPPAKRVVTLLFPQPQVEGVRLSKRYPLTPIPNEFGR
jgi:hypothetical protein